MVLQDFIGKKYPKPIKVQEKNHFNPSGTVPWTSLYAVQFLLHQPFVKVSLKAIQRHFFLLNTGGGILRSYVNSHLTMLFIFLTILGLHQAIHFVSRHQWGVLLIEQTKLRVSLPQDKPNKKLPLGALERIGYLMPEYLE